MRAWAAAAAVAAALLIGGVCAAGSTVKIAVIGSGPSGAASAHFLRQLYPSADVVIDVYESATVSGGRASHEVFHDEIVESGASLLVDQNRYIGELADAAGIERKRLPGKVMAVFDGAEVPFQTSANPAVALARVLWRYRWDLFNVKSSAAAFVEKFGRIYELQVWGCWTWWGGCIIIRGLRGFDLTTGVVLCRAVCCGMPCMGIPFRTRARRLSRYPSCCRPSTCTT